MILFCLDDDQITLDFLESVHTAFPQATILVRAFDRRAVLRLKGGPAAYIVREVLESAIKMARLALGSLKIDHAEIDRIETMYRTRDKERLAAQLESGDLHAASDRMITQEERKG